MKEIFDELKATYFAGTPEFKELSMGMSGDYRIAVEEGSTMVLWGVPSSGREITRIYNLKDSLLTI